MQTEPAHSRHLHVQYYTAFRSDFRFWRISLKKANSRLRMRCARPKGRGLSGEVGGEQALKPYEADGSSQTAVSLSTIGSQFCCTGNRQLASLARAPRGSGRVCAGAVE
jgi:hypothetical protein